MSNLAIFLVGVAVTIPASIAIGGLILAALADGRDDDRIRARKATGDPDAEGLSAGLTPPSSGRRSR